MGYWEVKESLGQLVDLSEEQQEPVLALCKSCLKEIEERLKADADPDSAVVTQAAAALAYYRIILKRSNSAADGGVSSFKAGDVSITQSTSKVLNQLADARSYYNQAMETLIPLCTDNGFAVTQVKIKVKP